MNKKNIALIAILILIFLIPIAYFFSTRKAENSMIQDAETLLDQNDWKVYTNNRVGYQFELPKNLSIDEYIQYPIPHSNQSIKINDAVSFSTGNDPYIVYAVETLVEVSNTTIEEWIQDKNIPNLPRYDNDLNNYKKIKIGGKDAYILNYGAVSYVMNNANIYRIGGYKGIAPMPNIDDEIYNHVISTFEFKN